MSLAYTPLVLVGYPLLTFLVILAHELGHAAVPLVVTRQPVTVQVGPAFSRPLLRVALGRITLDVRRMFFWGASATAAAH